MESKVSWNADYLALRKNLIAKMEGGSAYGMRIEDFENVVRASIGSVANTPALRRNVRDLMKEGDVQIIIGKMHVKMIRLKGVQEDKEAWRNAAKIAAAKVDADMKQHCGPNGAVECGMTRDDFKKHFPVWAECEAFHIIVKEVFRENNFALKYYVLGGLDRVLTSRININVIPQVHHHNVSSLLDILLKPTLTVKRRWCKGFTHALTSPEDVIVFLDGKVEDETGEETDRLIFMQHTVLLVDARAYEMLKAKFKEMEKTLIARQLL